MLQILRVKSREIWKHGYPYFNEIDTEYHQK